MGSTHFVWSWESAQSDELHMKQLQDLIFSKRRLKGTFLQFLTFEFKSFLNYYLIIIIKK